MYGLVNAAVQDLVCSKFGAGKWQEIKAKACVPDEMFNRMAPYPDELTYKLIGAAAEVLNLAPDDVQRAFGEYWVLFTGREGFGHLFEIAGSSLRAFLLNLDNLHGRVGENFAQLRPPSFTYDEIDARTLRMHYRSERAGLCPMVVGMLNGLSLRFATRLTIEHPVCSRLGASHCEFVISLPDGDA